MRHAERGFTLFEMGVTLLIIVFLVSAGMFATSEVGNAKRYRAQKDADALYNAQFGTRDVNGFVGDIGRLSLPANAPREMLTAKPGTLSNQQVLRGVTVGWHGPYIGYDPVGLTTDPWGNPWIIQNTGGAETGRIVSTGPDGILGTPDDIASPLTIYRTQQAQANRGEIDVVVYDPATKNYVTDNSVTVTATNPDGSGGLQSPAPVGVPAGGTNIHYRITNLTTGRHVVVVNGVVGGPYDGAVAYGTAWVASGTQSRVQLSLR